jgi:hypothetical protein
MRDVSEVSDMTANHARCWLVCVHREGRCGKVYLRSRLGRTYGGEVRACWAVGIWERLVRKDCEGILRSGYRGGEATVTTKEGVGNEMDKGARCLRKDACAMHEYQDMHNRVLTGAKWKMPILTAESG